MSIAFRMGGIFLGWLLLCFCAVANPGSPEIAAEVSMNQMAGRGDFLIVTLRLQDGEKLPFVVDTGASGTLIDQSLIPKLGESLGKVRDVHWGVVSTYKTYAAPRLYLGDVPLIMTNRVAAFDCKEDFSGENPPVMGMLGMDVLRHYCIQLDFNTGKLRLLDSKAGDKRQWGEAFPIMPLGAHDSRPAVAGNLLGLSSSRSLIDSGCTYDGWLMPRNFREWTNSAVPVAERESRSPDGFFDGENYPLVDVMMQKVKNDGIGLHFLARHLVTLDFPNQILYLKRQSVGPLADPGQKITAIKVIEPLARHSRDTAAETGDEKGGRS